MRADRHVIRAAPRPALLALGAWLLALAAPGAAATCDITPQGTSFGAYDPLAPAPLDGVGNIAVRCDSAVPFTLSLGTGTGSYADRRMTGASGSLGYNLYVDGSRAIVWGDGSGGTTTVSANAQSADIPIYGRIPAGQNVRADSYTDTLVVTISY